jgi:hypothetical protein
MRVIEKRMINAIISRKSFKSGNTEVLYFQEGQFWVYLHGKCIAQGHMNPPAGKQFAWIRLSDCGWRTSTTKSRLNALCDHFGFDRIHQHKHVWYHGDEPWHTSIVLTLKEIVVNG